MTFIKTLFLFLLSVSILGISSGCATLPNVSEKIDAAPNAQEPQPNRFGQRTVISKTEQSHHGTIAAIR